MTLAALSCVTRWAAAAARMPPAPWPALLSCGLGALARNQQPSASGGGPIARHARMLHVPAKPGESGLLADAATTPKHDDLDKYKAVLLDERTPVVYDPAPDAEELSRYVPFKASEPDGLYKAEAEHAQAELSERVRDADSYGDEDEYKKGFWAAEPNGLYASDPVSPTGVPVQNQAMRKAVEFKSGRT